MVDRTLKSKNWANSVPIAVWSHSSLFPQLYDLTALCSHSCMGHQLSVPSAVWFPSSLFPRLYGPTALCALSCMVSQLSVPTVPAGSPSRGGDITVYVPDKHQPSLPPPFFLFCSCVCFCLYSPFSCISFHKFSRQLSAFSLCSCGLISAVLDFSTLYLFMKVSLSPDVILCG